MWDRPLELTTCGAVAHWPCAAQIVSSRQCTGLIPNFLYDPHPLRALAARLPGCRRSPGVWRCGQQRYGEPGVAKGESLGCLDARSLAAEPIVRLILDGTVVRVRLDRKATSIVLLVVLGVREDGPVRIWVARPAKLGGPSVSAGAKIPH